MSVRPLPPALAEKARLELNEDPNRLNDDLQHIKDWVAKQPHLRARTDDQWLLTFLRGCKFSLEKAKEKLDLYYSVRTAAPELFRVRHTDPIFEVVLKDGGVLPLLKTMGPDAPRVVLIRAKRANMNKYSIPDILAATEVLQQVAFVVDDNLTVAGGTAIVDFEGLSVAHITQVTPTFLKKLSVIGQNASPIRMKGVHLINTPPGVETLVGLLKSLTLEKNRDKFHVHSSLEDLFKHISKDILPTDFGGNGGTTEDIVDHWLSKVSEYSAFLDEEKNFGTDEHKRPGKPKTAESMFGAEGSFRKLEFD